MFYWEFNVRKVGKSKRRVREESRGIDVSEGVESWLLCGD